MSDLPIPQFLIGGRMTRPERPGWSKVDPSTGAVQAEVPLGTPEDVAAATAAAAAAQPDWVGLSPPVRRGHLLALATLLRSEASALAELTTRESGIPMRVTGGLADRAADYLEYYAGYVDKIEGRVVPVFPESGFDYTLPEPYGVVAAISTWNGGVSGLCRKLAPALAAGNTVVAKPMELAPFSATRFAELTVEAGLPPGVVNLIHGDAATGRALVTDPLVDKVSFTGSPRAARAIQAAAAEQLTPCIFELGGKSPSLIFPDAGPGAAEAAAGYAMTMSGQGCLLPTRLLVHQAVHHDVVDRVVAAVEALRVGDPLDPETQVGPVVSAGDVDRIDSLLREAEGGGAGRLRTGGAQAGAEMRQRLGGCYVAPTVFDDVDPSSRLAQEEIFGPVLAVTPFATEDEAITLANGTPYGLAAYVFTEDLARAHRVARRVRCGYVSLNGIATVFAGAPFGGRGRSGYGREAGEAGLREFLVDKNVFLPT